MGWTSFPQQPSWTLPGINVGQIADARYAVANTNQGLHLQSFPEGHMEAHLDEGDACRGPLEHLIKDTKMAHGATLGALAGLVAAALSGDGKSTGALAALGGGVGGVIGANIPRRRRVVFRLRHLLSWCAAE